MADRIAHSRSNFDRDSKEERWLSILLYFLDIYNL